jgi:hypothetical protein
MGPKYELLYTAENINYRNISSLLRRGVNPQTLTVQIVSKFVFYKKEKIIPHFTKTFTLTVY